jgi:hypothetical protein
MILITKTNQNKVLILPHLFLTVPVTIPIISQSEIVNKITNTRMFMNTHTHLLILKEYRQLHLQLLLMDNLIFVILRCQQH